MEREVVSDRAWKAIPERFGCNLDETARSTGALTRKRTIRNGLTLLRLCLLYGFASLSLRETVSRAEIAGIGSMADVSLLERLLRCEAWLETLLADLLSQRAKKLVADKELAPMRVCIVDATVITIPGSKGVDWRVHLGFDLAHECIDTVQITDNRGGESLRRFAQQGDRLLIADRGYGHRAGFALAVEAENDILVRIAWQNVPLVDAKCEPVLPLEVAKRLASGQMADVDVCTRAEAGVGSVKGRLVVVKKSDDSAEQAAHKAKKLRKHGRAPAKGTIEACGYIFLFTTLRREQATAAQVAALYRLRWSVEIAIKRMKQVMKLGQLNAKNPTLCRVALLSKLIGNLLAEELVEKWRVFSPYGDDSCALPQSV